MVSKATDRSRHLHPLGAVLLAGTVPLFLGVFLSDLVYYTSYEIQWKNFASWLIVGGLIFGGFALLGAIITVLRKDRPPGRRVKSSGSAAVPLTGRMYFFKDRWLLCYVVLLLVWSLSFINALVHAKDAWASMPAGLILSALAAVLAIVATGFGYSTLPAGEAE